MNKEINDVLEAAEEFVTAWMEDLDRGSPHDSAATHRKKYRLYEAVTAWKVSQRTICLETPSKANGCHEKQRNDRQRRNVHPDPNESPLERIMCQRRISQSELARMSGVTQGAICHILKRRNGPRYETAERIAKALGLSIEDLLPGKKLSVW